MSETHPATADQDEPARYEIRIKGHLNQRWAGWFDGLTLTLEANGETRLTGPVADQAALHGLLKKVRDLGLPLVSVMPVDPKRAGRPHVNEEADHNDTTHTGTTKEIQA